MADNILIVILVTSFATYLSRFLGVVSAERIKESSKIQPINPYGWSKLYVEQIFSLYDD